MAGKLLRRVFVLGVIAGLILAARSYLERDRAPAEEVVQISFDDGSTQSLSNASTEGRELAEIARKVLEVGV